ncbi:hypothetical protein Pint_28813 [Pistacia integerrima]|nr:hypothetical protein Pint_28813 [Pistacia integerrima]
MKQRTQMVYSTEDATRYKSLDSRLMDEYDQNRREC